MTVVFGAIDHDEAVIASDTRCVRPDGSIYDDFSNPKIYQFNPRLLAVFSGNIGAIERLVKLLKETEDLTPKIVAEIMINNCSSSTGQERLTGGILGDEDGELVFYNVSGHISSHEEKLIKCPYYADRIAGNKRQVSMQATEKQGKIIYKEYLTGIPMRELAIRTVQFLGQDDPVHYSSFPEVWVLPKEGPAFCYIRTHVNNNTGHDLSNSNKDGERPLTAGSIKLDETGQKNYALGADQVKRLVYHQDIEGNMVFYDKDTGNQTFKITNRGILEDKDGYPVIDVNGRFNGKIIMSGTFDNTNDEDIIYINDPFIIPNGKKWVAFINLLEPVTIATSNANKTLKGIDAGFFNCMCTFKVYGSFGYDGVLPAGNYPNAELHFKHTLTMQYYYTDGSYDVLGNNFKIYYEIKEIQA